MDPSYFNHDPAHDLTVADELARALRNIMAINGEPYRNDPAAPSYRYDPGLFETHRAAWWHAKDALRRYDGSLNSKR